MTVSAHAIANKFIEISQGESKPVTNMQLQKLVFIAQGYGLAILGYPLYYNNTHAWQWGPVVPKLYKPLQKYGRDFVTDKIKAEDEFCNDGEELEIVQAVWKAYGHMSGGQLSTLTHKPNTPWSVTWNKDQFGVIPEQLVADHYRAIVESS